MCQFLSIQNVVHKSINILRCNRGKISIRFLGGIATTNLSIGDGGPKNKKRFDDDASSSISQKTVVVVVMV